MNSEKILDPITDEATIIYIYEKRDLRDNIWVLCFISAYIERTRVGSGAALVGPL